MAFFTGPAAVAMNERRRYQDYLMGGRADAQGPATVYPSDPRYIPELDAPLVNKPFRYGKTPAEPVSYSAPNAASGGSYYDLMSSFVPQETPMMGRSKDQSPDAPMPQAVQSVSYPASLEAFFSANDAAAAGAAGRMDKPVPFEVRGGTQAEMVPDRAGRYENLLQTPGGREYRQERFADKGFEDYKAKMTELANLQRFYTDDGNGGARLVTPPAYTQIMAGLARDELNRPRRTETWQEIIDPTTQQARQEFTGRYFDRQGMPQADPAMGSGYEQALLQAAEQRAGMQRAMLPGNPQFLMQSELEKMRQDSQFEQMLLQQGMLDKRDEARNATALAKEKMDNEARAADEEMKFMQRAAMEGAQGADGKFSMDLYQRNLAKIQADAAVRKGQTGGSFWNRPAPAADDIRAQITQNQQSAILPRIVDAVKRSEYNRAFGTELLDTIGNISDPAARKAAIVEAIRNSRDLNQLGDAVARSGAFSYLLSNNEMDAGLEAMGAGGMPFDIRSQDRTLRRPDTIVTRSGRNIRLGDEDRPGVQARGARMEEQQLAARRQWAKEFLNALYDAGY